MEGALLTQTPQPTRETNRRRKNSRRTTSRHQRIVPSLPAPPQELAFETGSADLDRLANLPSRGRALIEHVSEKQLPRARIIAYQRLFNGECFRVKEYTRRAATGLDHGVASTDRLQFLRDGNRWVDDVENWVTCGLQHPDNIDEVAFHSLMGRMSSLVIEHGFMADISKATFAAEVEAALCTHAAAIKRGVEQTLGEAVDSDRPHPMSRVGCAAQPDSPIAASDAEDPPLSQIEIAILEVLGSSRPPLVQSEISTELERHRYPVAWSKKPVNAACNSLERRKYVNRPDGDRQGRSLTQSGKEALANLRAQEVR